jgi:hypothetical protein
MGRYIPLKCRPDQTANHAGNTVCWRTAGDRVIHCQLELFKGDKTFAKVARGQECLEPGVAMLESGRSNEKETA